MTIKLLVCVKGGPGSGNWGHAGRPGLVGGSAGRGSGLVCKMNAADVEERYFHNAGPNTDAVLASGVIRGSEDNFAPYVYRGWTAGMGNQTVVFGVPKRQLHNFRFTFTNEVASNLKDTHLSDAGVKVIVYDKSTKLYYDLTKAYESGSSTEAELLTVWENEMIGLSGIEA